MITLTPLSSSQTAADASRREANSESNFGSVVLTFERAGTISYKDSSAPSPWPAEKWHEATPLAHPALNGAARKFPAYFRRKETALAAKQAIIRTGLEALYFTGAHMWLRPFVGGAG